MVDPPPETPARPARGERPALRVRDHVLQQRNGQTLADTRSLVEFLVLARLERDLLDHLAHELRHFDRDPRGVPAAAAILIVSVTGLLVPALFAAMSWTVTEPGVVGVPASAPLVIVNVTVTLPAAASTSATLKQR